MKKLFISALAIASLVACSKDELVKQQSPAAIGFAGAFVENATRSSDPSTKTADLTAFKVWAFMDETDGTVFEDQEVTKNGDAWTYSPLQYRTPGHTYYFGALAPMNSENWVLDTANANKLGAGVVSFTNVDGTEDLLYAATSVTTDDDINKQPESVNLTFNHLLSKVKFSFTNSFPADNYWITVSNIQMTAPAAGTIDLAVENWWDNDDWQLTQDEVTLAFGDMEVEKLGKGARTASAYERLTIPASADQEYVVTFDVELFVGKDSKTAVSALKNTLTTTITGAALEMGKAYNFHAELNAGNIAGGDGKDEDDTLLTPIVFEVAEVKGWVVDNGYDGGKIETEFQSANVSTAAELLNAVEAGASEIKLLENINLNGETLVFTPFDPSVRSTETTTVITDFVLDLNGNTLTGGIPDSETASGSDISAVVVDGGAKLVINGGAINGTEYGVYVKNGEVTINDVAVSAGTSAVQVYVGTANIYGGTFKATKSDVYVVNCIDAKYNSGDAKVNIYGGTFTNFNPGNNLSEGTGTNFVAAGYISLPQADGTYEVVELAGEITLDADIKTASSLFINDGVSATINLNGFSIINESNNDALEVGDAIIVYGDLTINGEGTVQGGTRAVWARGSYGATVTINGGDYVGAVLGGCEVIYASGDGKITINDGTFKAATEDVKSFAAPQYAALNLHGDGKNGCDIKVYGGSFYKFDPQNNVSENKKNHSSQFCAEGYTTEADGDWFKVVAK